MKEKGPRVGFGELTDTVRAAWDHGNYKGAEELILMFEEFADDTNHIQLLLDQTRFYIAREALAKGQFNEAENALYLIKEKYHEAAALKNEIEAAKETLQHNVPGSTTRDTNDCTETRAHSNETSTLHTETEVNVLEEIVDNPPVVVPPIDPEEEYRQKEQLMTRNTILLRGIVLRMQSNFAICNKREGTLDGFNRAMMPDFNNIMQNINTQIQQWAACLQTFNLKDAETCIAKAEAIFVELCPEELRTKKSSKEQNYTKHSGNNILSEVKPLNYQPHKRDDLTVKGDNIDVMKCLRVAEKAMSIKDFGKAEKFLNKAERIHPTPAAKKLLEHIRIVKEARLVADRETAERQAKAAQECAEKNERAEKEAAQRKARVERIITKRKARAEQQVPGKKARADQETPSQPITINISEEVIEIIDDGDIFGLNSKIDKKPPGKETSNVRESITEQMKIFSQPLKNPTTINDQSMKKPEKPDLKSQEGKKRRGEKCLAQAREAFSNEDLNAAEKLAKKGYSIYPSEEIRRFVTKIQSEVNVISPTVNENTNPNSLKKTNKQAEKAAIKAKDLVKTAVDCVAVGYLDKAEKLLQNARASDPNVDVKEAEASIRAARASRSSTDSTIDPKSEDKCNDLKSRAEMILKMADSINHTKNDEVISKQMQIELNSKEINKSVLDGEMSEEKDINVIASMAGAKQFYRNALKAFSGNDEAETLAVNSLVLDPLTKTKELANKINDKKSMTKQQVLETVVVKPPTPLITSDQRDEIDQNLKLWKDLNFSNKGNTDEAEKVLMQSKPYGECKDTEELGNKIKKFRKSQKSTAAGLVLNYGSTSSESEYVTANETASSDENAEVDKCIYVASKAISSENLKKAKKFLQKAQRIQPTTKTRDLLADVEHSLQLKEENEAKAEKLVASATEAIDKEDYNFAEMLLTNARIKYKSSVAKHLLEKIKSQPVRGEHDEEDKIPFWRKFRGKNNPKRTLEKQKASAEEYYTLANSYIQEGKLEDAETILIIAQNTYPTETANELLSQIRDELYSRDAGQLMKSELSECTWELSKRTTIQGIDNRNVYKSNSYVQMAQRAFLTGNHKVAEEFLLEADKLCPCTETKHSLKQVQNAINFMNAPPAKKKNL